MKSLLTTALVGIAALGVSLGSAEAAGKYPEKKPEYQDWSFAGPFGTYDRAALQRGFKVFKEVCSACHSADLLAFRNLSQPGGPEFTEDQIKTMAADEYTVVDAEPDEDGEPVERPAVLADRWPSPWANANQAKASNGGAYPPDFSLLAKARAVERGFPNFVFDVFTQYQEQGPDYLYALLTGYPTDEPNDEGTYDNPYFIAGKALAMAPPLSEGIVAYDDGAPETVEQYSKDVVEFMMWVAEPKLEERKSIGLKVMIFLIIFAGLLYMTKRRVFAAAGKH